MNLHWLTTRVFGLGSSASNRRSNAARRCPSMSSPPMLQQLEDRVVPSGDTSVRHVMFHTSASLGVAQMHQLGTMPIQGAAPFVSTNPPTVAANLTSGPVSPGNGLVPGIPLPGGGSLYYCKDALLSGFEWFSRLQNWFPSLHPSLNALSPNH
jgi:hypothetical protein